MAVLSRVSYTSQQRLDLSHLLASDSFNAFDFRTLVSSFSGSDKAYVVRGFEVTAKSGLTISINVANSLVFNPQDANGSFYAGLSSDPVEQITLPADQPIVYVEAKFANQTTAPVNTGYWDPLALIGNSAAGAEYTAATDFEAKIVLEITSNTVGFSDGSIPLMVATTAASSITTMEDRRENLYRLGRGGASPNALYKYQFASSRQEPVSSGAGVGDAVDSPWRAVDASGSLNDKAFKSFKDWADAIMTSISEVKGSPIWYLSSSAVAPVSNISLNQTFFDTLGHSIQASSNAAFKWKTVSGTLRLTSEGSLAGSSPYSDGLIRWKSNYTNLEWHLGGTFVSSSDHNFSALRFTSPAPADGGNIYLKLERETAKGSGASVDWKNNISYTGFVSNKAVSGDVGDFTGIALGDYIRKESEGYSRYYKVVKFSDGTLLGTYTLLSNPNKVADSSIIALELENISDPSLGILGSASTEPLKYFRSRYDDTDVIADTTTGVFSFQDADYYWLGRRQGNLFFLRSYGTMQEGEEVTTIDAAWAKGRQGGGNDLIIKHTNGAEYDVTNGYQLTSGPGNLLTLHRQKRNNTVDTPSSGDNSGSVLTYTLPSPIGLLSDTDGLWVRLSDTTDGALQGGNVTSSADALDNTDLTTNRWQVRSVTTTPPRTFDDKDVYLLARKFTLSGVPYLLFFDGSMLTADGQWFDQSVVIQSDLFLRNKTLNSVLFIGADGKIIEDNARLFFDPTISGGTFAAINFRMSYDSANDRDHMDQATQRDIWFMSGNSAKQMRVGGIDTDVYIPGNLLVDGTTTSINTSNLLVEDKLITIGSGLLVDTAQGSGIEVADNTKQATSITSTGGLDTVVVTYGSAHGYSLFDYIGFDTNASVGGIQFGQINQEYRIVAFAGLVGEAEIVSATQIRLKTNGTATSTITVNYSNPTTYGQSFLKPWSIRVSDADSNYTGRTSWVFRVKGVATAPSISPVASYGIVPTAHSTAMISTRIPFVNDDNAGPSGVDSTLNFSSDFAWDNTTSTLLVSQVQVANFTDYLGIPDPVEPNANYTRMYADATDNLIYQRTEDGNISLVSNPQGNVYEETVSVVDIGASGNNQMNKIVSPPQSVIIPKDRKKHIGVGLIASTDGSTATVLVNKMSHGLVTGDLVTITANNTIGGIAAPSLSVIASPIVALTVDTFTYSATANSSSIADGYLDLVIAQSQRRYIVGESELEIYRNGQLLTRGEHYNENGTNGSLSTSVTFLIQVDPSDTLTYRIDSNGGLLVKIAGGGGLTSLQAAYDAGSSISTNLGDPVFISTTSGNALSVDGGFRFDGVLTWVNDNNTAPIPAASDIAVYMQNRIIYQRTEDGNVEAITNVAGSVYEENATIVAVPANDNQQLPGTGSRTLPKDKTYLLGSKLKATTDGSTAIVIVNKLAHGLSGSDLVTIVTAATIGGISGVNLSVTNGAITVINANSFSYTAGALSVSASTGSLDSVYSTLTRQYRVGAKELEIYRNGIIMVRDVDYTEVGSLYTYSNTVSFVVPLVLTDVITYRIDSNGGKVFINSGSGSGSLQDAYDLSPVINTNIGQPVIFQGAATTVAEFYGNILVTGLVL